MKPVFRLIIAGSRKFNNYSLLRDICDHALERVVKTHEIEIISGTAPGADILGERYAEERGHEIIRFPADWDKHGKAAGPIRNAEMSQYAHAAIVFWDGWSKGTKDMIDKMNTAGKQLFICRVVFYGD